MKSPWEMDFTIANLHYINLDVNEATSYFIVGNTGPYFSGSYEDMPEELQQTQVVHFHASGNIIYVGIDK